MERDVTLSNPIGYQSDRLEFSTAVVREEYYAPHVHPARFQVELVLDGETECGIGRQRFTLSQQHYSLVNPDTEHYNITRQWKHALFLIFDRDIVDETAWQIYRFMSHPVAFTEKVAPCSPDFATILTTLMHEVQQPERPGRGLFFDTALIQLSVTLLRMLRGNHTQSALTVLNPKSYTQQIARAVEYIRQSFAMDLSLDDLAGVAGMSRYHFLRCFKAQVGTTPHTYMMHTRLRAAAALLRSTTQAITDIALSCGFGSLSHFGAMFRRTYRCSPSTYRHARQREIAI
jgi:AraC family transcriptional regulator